MVRPRTVAFALVAAAGAGLGAAFVAAEATWRAGMGYVQQELDDARAGRFQGRPAILCVGDSFTAGELAESGRGWWAWLPGALQARGVAGAEAISLAVAGSPSPVHVRQVQAWRRESGQRFDLLIAVTGANDWDALELQRAFVAEHPDRVAWPLRRLYQAGGGALYGVHVVWGWLRLEEPGDPSQVMAPALKRYWYQHPDYEPWLAARLERDVLALKAEAEAAGGSLVLGSYVAHDASRMLREIAARHGVPYFDEQGPDSEARRAEYAGHGWLADDRWHLADAGHAAYADRLADFLAPHLR